MRRVFVRPARPSQGRKRLQLKKGAPTLLGIPQAKIPRWTYSNRPRKDPQMTPRQFVERIKSLPMSYYPIDVAWAYSGTYILVYNEALWAELARCVAHNDAKSAARIAAFLGEFA